MAKHYRTLIKNALNKGYFVSVYDGEEWQVKRSNKFQSIIDAIESVDEAEIKIRKLTGDFLEFVGWAYIIQDLADEETIIDYTESPLMEEIIPKTIS